MTNVASLIMNHSKLNLLIKDCFNLMYTKLALSRSKRMPLPAVRENGEKWHSSFTDKMKEEEKIFQIKRKKIACERFALKLKMHVPNGTTIVPKCKRGSSKD